MNESGIEADPGYYFNQEVVDKGGEAQMGIFNQHVGKLR